ncbi:hypothetical protein HN997_01990, partial [archaeon]|nr:hypothetical protein [archaeon]
LEQQRRRFYVLKSELSTLENQKNEKEKFLIESKKEIQLIEHNISSLFDEIKYAKSFDQAEALRRDSKGKIEDLKEKISEIELKILENEKQNAILEQDIKRESKLKEDIIKLDNCPTCKQPVKNEYKSDISKNANKKIGSAKEDQEKNQKLMEEFRQETQQTKKSLEQLEIKLNEINIDLFKLKNSEEKKEQMKRISVQQQETQSELGIINQKSSKLREEFGKLKDIEEKYDDTRLKLQELSFVDIDVDTEITIKKREVNRMSIELKKTIRDIEESEQELKKIIEQLIEKERFVEKKEVEEQKLYEKFQKFFNDRNEIQDKQKVLETDVIGLQHTIRNHEDRINHLKIQKAQFNAQIDSLKTELAEFGNIEVLNLPLDQIKERLQKSQFRISRFGNVNLRALEVFDKVQEQVELIQQKVETIEKEKEKVQKIITEIDKKKKKAFLTTLHAVNDLFTRNFTQLSRKGEVILELENKKEPFEGGLNILVKVSRGRYFDITSLSGGEKTMVALSLIFAIQEYKPYCFYIFDEIDAALDKHNSELLAALIKKYMTTGQYIIITHNDTLISEATNLYGVSMQENISKIISLKL